MHNKLSRLQFVMNWHNFFPLLLRSGPCYYNPNPQLWVFETPAIPRHSENEFKQSYTGVSAATFRFPISINFFPLGVTSSWRRIWDWNFGPVLRTYICLTSRGPNASAEKAFSGGKNFKLVSLFEIHQRKSFALSCFAFHQSRCQRRDPPDKIPRHIFSFAPQVYQENKIVRVTSAKF